MELLEIKKPGKQKIVTKKTKLNEINSQIKFIKYGRSHVVLITKNNEVYVFGENYEKQLGLEDSIEFVKNFTKINYLHFGIINYLFCDNSFTFILNNLNNIYFTGSFSNFKFNKFSLFLNENLKENLIKSLQCGSEHLIVLTNDNYIYGFSKNKSGQLGLPKTIEYCNHFVKLTDFKIKDFKCVLERTMILDFYGNIYQTGENTFGQLGLNKIKENKVFKFTKMELPFKIKQIFIDSVGSFFINEFNELFGTGYNLNGQLGLGDYENRFIFTKINLNHIDYGRIDYCKSNNFLFMD